LINQLFSIKLESNLFPFLIFLSDITFIGV